MPFGRAVGVWDVWPSWALYSPRPEELFVTVHENDVETLPEHVQKYVSPPGFDERCHVRIDQWTLEELSAPMHPSARIEHSVAVWLATRFDLDSVRVQSVDSETRAAFVDPVASPIHFTFNATPNDN